MPQSLHASSAENRDDGAVAPETSTWRRVFSGLQQIIFIWIVVQLGTNFFGQLGTKSSISKNSNLGKVVSNHLNAHQPSPSVANLAWSLGQKIDVHVYMTTSASGDIFGTSSNWLKEQDSGLPKFIWPNITFGDWDIGIALSREFNVHFPLSVFQNGNLWLDVFLTRNGASPDPYDDAFNPEDVHRVRKLLTPYFPRIKVRKEKRLLQAELDVRAEEFSEADVAVPHWHPNITLALVSDAVQIPYGNLPPPILEHIHIVPDVRDETGATAFYLPIVYPNDFWHLREHYMEINSTTPSLPVQINLQPMSYFKFQMFASLSSGFKEAEKQHGSSTSAELDEIKRMFLETNPWFLALTATVSMLHVLFEMLAFTSDVSHWRQKKELVGVSVRTIISNVFIQIIVLLYLIDNNENTSWMILLGSGIGVIIEAWKVTKAVDVRVVRTSTRFGFPYKLGVRDKHVLSEDERKTQEYDRLACRYVSYIAVPLLAGYTAYSLLYNTHRGWYSFIISTLTSFVYMFGFAQLIPQLIINYKLKSVAHMPMKAMIYKTLSTVVDDFFAFCIKMPLLHRLACFRDDVVFLVFLYQRWIYRVDPKRINEYGQIAAEDTALKKNQ